jgi:hypothetical protein
MADLLDPVRVLRALASAGVGDELHALGVRDLSGYGDDDYEVRPSGRRGTSLRSGSWSSASRERRSPATRRLGSTGLKPHPIATADYLESSSCSARGEACARSPRRPG